MRLSTLALPLALLLALTAGACDNSVPEEPLENQGTIPSEPELTPEENPRLTPSPGGENEPPAPPPADEQTNPTNE